MPESDIHTGGALSSEGDAESRRPVETRSERVIPGVGVAPGIAIGPAFLYAREDSGGEGADDDPERRAISPEEAEEEVKRFERAVTRSESDLKKITSIAREKIGESSADIFQAQMLMLRDEAVYGSVVECIRKEHVRADFAVQDVMTRHRRRMETATDDEHLRERANDLLDVQERVIRHLRRGKILTSVSSDSIVVAEDLNATDIVLFSRRSFLGCAMDYGGATSHVSILARSLGVPAVVGTHGLTDEVEDDETIVLDGLEGRVVVNPTEQTLEESRQRREAYEKRRERQRELVPLPAKTLDDHAVPLRANLEFEEEVEMLDEYGADGIGLFRTEIPFLMQRRLSFSEEEQYDAYRRVVETVAPAPTTFRVLDVGGDKILPMARREQNPVLGWRGLRILLDRQSELLQPQLRAILRAAAHGPVRLLLPMVTNLDDVHRFREVLEEVKAQLDEAGRDYDPDPEVGIMVEVPSVALLAERFAPEVDFFSIGTNDLTQYVLAVDRGNDLVVERYDELHPAVLVVIRRVIEAAREAGVPVSLCGEMASNPRAVPILVGLGISELSASPSYLPEIKRVVRAVRRPDAENLAERALAAGNPDAVHALLDQWFAEHAHDLDVTSFTTRRDEQPASSPVSAGVGADASA